MRDNFESKVILDENTRRMTVGLEKRTLDFYVKRYHNDNATKTYEDGFRDLNFLKNGSISSVVTLIPLKYGRGDDLGETYELCFADMLSRYQYLAGELAKGHPQGYIYGYKGNPRRNRDDHSIYTWLCWFYCLANDSDSMGEIADYLAEPQLDRLTDVLLRYSSSKRAVGAACNSHDVFGLLEQVIEAHASTRVELVEQYLNEWPQRIGQLSGNSLGIKCGPLGFSKIKNKQDLIDGIDANYQGFFAWEAALVVKFFHIDDSSFKDNKFYPYDLVHFRPPLNNQDYLEELKVGFSKV